MVPRAVIALVSLIALACADRIRPGGQSGTDVSRSDVAVNAEDGASRPDAGDGSTSAQDGSGPDANSTPSDGGSEVTDGSSCGAIQEPCCPGGVCALGLDCTNGGCTSRPAGETGRSCQRNGDCGSGICLPVGGGRNVCTTACASASECVSGWSCQPLVGQPSDICQCESSPEMCNGRDDDCNGQGDDEPAVDLACSARFGAGGVCRQGGCECGGGATLCGGRCAFTASDPENCRTCGNRCSAPAHATPLCSAGSCDFACNSGWTRCGSACADTTTDPDNCNGCSIRCPSVTNGMATCRASRCGYDCNPGYVDDGSDCVSDPCVQRSDGQGCGEVFPRVGVCVGGRCTQALAVCEYKTFGVNWQPNRSAVYWNGTYNDQAWQCSCNGNTLSDGRDSQVCAACAFVGRYDWEGGSGDPDGVTTSVWGCF